MSEPRKHHLVAQLYQRGFAKKKGKSFQVLVLNKTTGKGGLRNVENTFTERDWNTIEDAEGTKEFGVEKLLADHVDALAAPALQARWAISVGQCQSGSNGRVHCSTAKPWSRDTPEPL